MERGAGLSRAFLRAELEAGWVLEVGAGVVIVGGP